MVWSSDLKLDNAILLRKVVKAATTVSATNLLTLNSPDFKNGGTLPKDFTCDGKGISPSFSWSNVPVNAQSLVLIMDTEPGPLRPGEVDTGKHFYLTIFNIPKTVNSIASGATNIGILGQNFQGKAPGYTPPCSQGPGAKKYSIYLYALSSKLTLSLSATEATESSLLTAMTGKVISSASLDVFYSRT
ncbi:MAG: YbhB/YbcL family Raf kinase inhibitor-like protein [Actinobacteria bacterium]|nr:YbhB/YbcL family Raf kinase inhibitor-like protein [Actinomycetota bacterium]